LEVLYFEILVENGNVKIQGGWRLSIEDEVNNNNKIIFVKKNK
jgi:hypothetical protein